MTLALCLLLALPMTTRAEERKDYYGMYQAALASGDEAMMAEIRAEIPARLHPAKDNDTGLWGYVNFLGEWAIPPQYSEAFGFRGNYAIAVLCPEDMEADWWNYDCEGVIDREGNWVLPPEYSLYSGDGDDPAEDPDGGAWVVYRHSASAVSMEADGTEIVVSDAREGFFDIPSGYFSGLKWYRVWPYYCEGNALIPVVDTNYRTGYADRTTGELVIPCLYASVDPAIFHEGVVITCYEDPEKGQTEESFILTEQGDIVPLADNLAVHNYSDPSEGRIAVEDRATGLYGFVDLRGNLVIQPQFARAEDFQGGYAAVLFPEGDWGYVDRDGVIVSRGIAYDSDWWGPKRKGGVCVLQTDENEWTARAVTGETLFTLRTENLWSLYPPMDNGLCWFCAYPPGHWKDRTYGLVDLTGNVVSEAVWLLSDYAPMDFSEGLQPVIQIIDGQRKMGYLNEQGELALPLIYDTADSFCDGLAWVTRDGETGYIDAFGHEIYFWTD